MTATMRCRWVAAGWYAAVGVIPVVGILAIALLAGVRLASSWGGLLLLLLAPLCAALMGFLFGGRPLCIPTRPWRAALRGVAVAGAAFLLFVLIVSLAAGGENAPPLLERFGFGLLVGSVSVGWMALAVGAVTGWLLARRGASAPSPSVTLQPES